MSVYIVTYDLNAPGQDYSDLIKEIKKYSHCYALKSAYFIDTHEEAADIRDKLGKFLDKNDILYVMELQKHWASNRLMACATWLKDKSRTWS